MTDILVIAPHPDDEVLGVGGTIARHGQNGDRVSVLTVSGHMPPLYPEDAYARTLEEAERAHEVLGVGESVMLGLPATMVPSVPVSQLNDSIFQIIDRIRPSVVFCPFPDRHLDHRAVFESVMVATRPKNAAGRAVEMVAAYEVLSATHWTAPHIEPNFVPNWFIDITAQIDLKARALGCFVSQIGEFPDPRSIEATRALAKFRGSQAGFAFAEAFHIIRKSG